MAARDVRKYSHAIIDGKGYAGQIEEFNPPKLTLKTEEWQSGAMALPVKLTMGMEALDCDFSMICYSRDILAAFSLSEGATIPVTVREMLESFDGTVTGVVHTMRGKITEIDPGTSKPGEKPSVKIALNLNYYKLVHGSTTVHEIDVANMIMIVNGVDVLAPARAALGL